ncbi:MAG: rod shape-determining protein MreC [Endomicrobium sp.]|jgi:rod shape-determining protein MreC|nr:rod shape-determining protein MreC [Endomicrobium sp.]
MFKKYKDENVIFIFILTICFYFISYKETQLVILVRKTLYKIIYATINYSFKKNDLLNMHSIVALRQENTKYKIKNQQLLDRLRSFNSIYQEYENLRTLLHLKERHNIVSTFAHIYVRDCNEWYKSIILNKGIDHGLYNGLPVVIFNKQENALCAMGKIDEIYQTSSKVILITKALYMLPVMIKNKDIHCLAEGTNSNLLKITYIPKDANVKCGDRVIVSPLSVTFQRDILVGIIIKVLQAIPGDNFKTAVAKVCFDNNVIYKAIICFPLKQVNNEKCSNL